MEENIVEKLDRLGQQIHSWKGSQIQNERQCPKNDAKVEVLNDNAVETSVSSWPRGLNRSRHYRSMPFRQGILPRTQRGIRESIGHEVPYYCAGGLDIQSEYTCC